MGTARPSTARYRVMAFLLGLSFLTYFDRVCIVRVQEEVKRDLGLSSDQFGLVLGAFWLAYMLFEIPGGWLGDRYGPRRALTRVVLMWSLFTLLTGTATGFGMLLAYRFLFGAGEAGAYPNMARVQATWLPAAARARAGGLLWLAARWGGAFSPVLFGMLVRGIDAPAAREWLDAVPGLAGVAAWRLAFGVAGLFGLVWCVLWFPWFRDDPAAHRGVNAGELALIRAGRGDAEGHAAGRDVWRALVRSRSLWALAALYVFGSFGWSFFVSWMPKYLQDRHGVSFGASEDFWKQPLFYGGISCLVGGVVSDRLVRATRNRRWGRAACPLVGITTAAAAIGAVPWVADPDAAIVLICLAGAAYDFGQAAAWASIVDVGGRHTGVAAGFVNMVGNSGNAAQPYIGSVVFSAFGWGPLFGLYAGAFLLAAAMWLVIDPRKSFDRKGEPC